MRNEVGMLQLLLKVWRSPGEHTALSGSGEERHFGWTDLRRLLIYIGPHRGLAFRTAILAVLAASISAPQPLVSKYVIDAVFNGGNRSLIPFLMSFLVSLVIAGSLVVLYENYCLTRFQQSVILDIQQSLFGRVLRLPKSFFDSKQTGYLMSRIVQDTFRLQSLLTGNLIQTVPQLLQLPMAFALLTWLNWRLTVMAALCAPVLFMIALRAGVRSRSVGVRLMERNASVYRELHQSLSSVLLIKSFATEAREHEKFERRLQEAVQASLEQVVLSTSSSALVSACVSLMVIACTWFGITEVLSGRMSVGDFVAFGGYLMYVFGPLQALSALYVSAQMSGGAVKRVFELLEAVPEDSEDNLKISVENIMGRIEFEQVTFSYDGKAPALQDISFVVNPRQLVAIVGPSGSGKSTLVSLIIRLYKPTAGRILVDNRDVNEIQLCSLRQKIGIVSQEVLLLDDTIEANIRYGNELATDEEIRTASRAACAEEFITALPEGYMTMVGERGVKLSQGQRQRISIARALVKNPHLLILDEPTAALDAITENALKRALRLFAESRTVFVIAHRLSTVISADKILVLADGRLVQEGSHDELLEQEGLYARMCREQIVLDTEGTTWTNRIGDEVRL